ncbi:MAG: hypothetical protein KGM43_11090 [Planctomycetota bacterium]|nr:hypothetical protein [Planctomycetota bacterium]
MLSLRKFVLPVCVAGLLVITGCDGDAGAPGGDGKTAAEPVPSGSAAKKIMDQQNQTKSKKIEMPK